MVTLSVLPKEYYGKKFLCFKYLDKYHLLEWMRSLPAQVPDEATKAEQVKTFCKTYTARQFQKIYNTVLFQELHFQNLLHWKACQQLPILGNCTYINYKIILPLLYLVSGYMYVPE